MPEPIDVMKPRTEMISEAMLKISEIIAPLNMIERERVMRAVAIVFEIKVNP